MIISNAKFLSTKSLVLASSSPRRNEILQIIPINFKAITSFFEENLDPHNFNSPAEYVEATAKGKAEEVMARLCRLGDPVDLIIGADTCVTLDGEIFGKPKSKQNAIITLNKLSGKMHKVITGVCLKYRRVSNLGKEEWHTSEFHETTSVKFDMIPLTEIEAYVETEEPLDKAGGYGIQGLGGTLIESIQGDYYNVMGFPLHTFCKKLLPIISEWKSEI